MQNKIKFDYSSVNYIKYRLTDFFLNLYVYVANF